MHVFDNDEGSRPTREDALGAVNMVAVFHHLKYLVRIAGRDLVGVEVKECLGLAE